MRPAKARRIGNSKRSTDDKLWYVLCGCRRADHDRRCRSRRRPTTTRYDTGSYPHGRHHGRTWHLHAHPIGALSHHRRQPPHHGGPVRGDDALLVAHLAHAGARVIDKGDDERLSNISGRRPFIDLNEKDGGQADGPRRAGRAAPCGRSSSGTCGAASRRATWTFPTSGSASRASSAHSIIASSCWRKTPKGARRSIS